MQPGRKFCLSFEFRRVEIQSHESLLHEIARRFFGSDVAKDESEKRLLVFVNQLSKRILVAGLKRTNQQPIRVYRWRGIHRSLENALLQFGRVTQRIGSHLGKTFVLCITENGPHRENVLQNGMLEVALRAMNFLDRRLDPLRIASVGNDRVCQLAVPFADPSYKFFPVTGEFFLNRLQRFLLLGCQPQPSVNPIMIINRVACLVPGKNANDKVASAPRCDRNQQNEKRES